ncbi:MAG: murein L,D-transpeptidase catalytic domain family protein [Chitinophagaceae bacterium]|nr:MAG: murein L,D-transpeptidase catalytic domain family protein [Chitinophagaceae bacterium]
MKPVHPIFIYCAFFAWLGISWSAPNRQPNGIPAGPGSPIDSLQLFNTNLYNQSDLSSQGLSREAFDYAMRGYNKLLAKGKISRPGYLTICDFSQSSRRKRLYLLDITTGEILMRTYVAHGKNSGLEYATRFSNRAESRQSSLGFYTTLQTYFGGHGLSLRVQGMEKGINDKALARNIVIHGADYLGDGRSGDFMGRSYGCPAIPEEECGKLIDLIKNGTCLFIYHPTKQYLKGSRILNG